MNRNTGTASDFTVSSGSPVCQRFHKLGLEMPSTSDHLDATDAELKASRQVISLLQRQLELFHVEKEGLEKLIVSQAKCASKPTDSPNDVIDSDGNMRVDDALASIESGNSVQRKLLKLIRTQLYAKDEENVKLKAGLKESQNEKEQMNLQIHNLEDDLTKLKSEISLLRENLALRDETIISLSNEVFEQTNSKPHLTFQRRQSTAEYISNRHQRQDEKQLAKLNATLEAYKKTNELLTQNVIKLTDRCSALERKEMESKSQAQELEARCCQIQSKLLSLLKEIEQSSKPVTRTGGGDEDSSQRAEFIDSEPVKLLIKRLLEDKSLDIPLSWKEGNRTRARKNFEELKNSNKLECDELGFYITSGHCVMSSPDSSPNRQQMSGCTQLKRGISEATYLPHLETVDERLELRNNVIGPRNEEQTSQKSVDSVKDNEETWRLYWDEFIKNIDKTNLNKSKEFKQLLRSGVPQEYRCKIWKALIELKVGEMRRQCGPEYYQNLLEPKHPPNSKMNPSSKQIELDLLRTLPNNKYFDDVDSPGTVRLRRILTAFASHEPHIGYCQGMNRLAAVALLVLPEEEAFWCLVAIIDKIRPTGYYNDLWLAQVDSNVVMDFVTLKMPDLSEHFQENSIELSLFAWFLTIFVDGTLPALFLRLWDCFLYEGDKVLFRAALALLKMYEHELLQLNSSVAINSFLRSRLNDPVDMDQFFKIAFESINPFPGKVLRNRRELNFRAMQASINSMSGAKRTPSPAVL